ncbi:mannan endo-1,6-alpha-mannosidase [Saccharata proteae CBS 121410]|uniref:Mannan endo-1,6-alpha-mannosidase n=1 Tax=Saccharata proteae CBS 121410 TaxID=1314787 RepID=A0A6A5YER0_9PEZI|nr:mannan endo-1,6-alpha-mannosidase [Saccharata proteae CBS 121410]
MNFFLHSLSILGTLSLLLHNGYLSLYAGAVEIDITSADSVRNAAAEVAYGMMIYYTGNRTGDVPGNLPSPYYWWEAGAMFMSMVEYWYYTGDTTYLNETKAAILHQVGDDNDFMPANQTKTEGNDDQVFWSFAAMTAAELKFPDPDDGHASWVAQAQAVFNEQAARWDEGDCGGGLRWQIYTFNAGWNYKNTISNGGFFQLAARLARYTGNESYTEWANKTYDWFEGTSLMNPDTWQVNDGTSTTSNCSTADQTQWTYNYGTMIVGCAFLANHTGSELWKNRTNGLLDKALDVFYPTNMGPNIMVEVACEPYGTCDNDQVSFKAYLSRWLALTAQMMPERYDDIMTKLLKSAQGAAGQCSGSGKTADSTCGREWNSTVWDGTMGVGEQMSALQAISAAMLDLDKTLAIPVTLDTGGTSKSDPSAGTGSSSGSTDGSYDDSTPITAGDKAGASILTIVMVGGTLAGAWYMMVGDF